MSHLKGAESVADGMTKPLLGQSFAGFLNDLGLKGPEVKMKKVNVETHSSPAQGQQVALKALVAGGMLI